MVDAGYVGLLYETIGAVSANFFILKDFNCLKTPLIIDNLTVEQFDIRFPSKFEAQAGRPHQKRRFNVIELFEQVLLFNIHVGTNSRADAKLDIAKIQMLLRELGKLQNAH